jgi:hypothetical protein
MRAHNAPGDSDVGAALERHRSALHALPGVLATGVGRGAAEGSPDLTIQIFVRSLDHIAAVRASARAILGTVPFHVFVVGEVFPGRTGTSL